jgi:hypothetical protein
MRDVRQGRLAGNLATRGRRSRGENKIMEIGDFRTFSALPRHRVTTFDSTDGHVWSLDLAASDAGLRSQRPTKGFRGGPRSRARVLRARAGSGQIGVGSGVSRWRRSALGASPASPLPVSPHLPLAVAPRLPFPCPSTPTRTRTRARTHTPGDSARHARVPPRGRRDPRVTAGGRAGAGGAGPGNATGARMSSALHASVAPYAIRRAPYVVWGPYGAHAVRKSPRDDRMAYVVWIVWCNPACVHVCGRMARSSTLHLES